MFKITLIEKQRKEKSNLKPYATWTNLDLKNQSQFQQKKKKKEHKNQKLTVDRDQFYLKVQG